MIIPIAMVEINAKKTIIQNKNLFIVIYLMQQENIFSYDL